MSSSVYQKNTDTVLKKKYSFSNVYKKKKKKIYLMFIYIIRKN